MSYSVRLDKNANKFLERLPDETALRIIKKLEELKEEPFRFLEHFEGRYYKLRIGDYRALIDIDFEKRVLLIRMLDKRARIYNR